MSTKNIQLLIQRNQWYINCYGIENNKFDLNLPARIMVIKFFIPRFSSYLHTITGFVCQATIFSEILKIALFIIIVSNILSVSLILKIKYLCMAWLTLIFSHQLENVDIFLARFFWRVLLFRGLA